MKVSPRHLLTGVVYIFALIGLFFVIVFVAMRLGLTNSWSGIDRQQETFLTEMPSKKVWSDSAEWNVFAEAVSKDIPLIKKASAVADVDPKLITAILAVEQLRLFYTERAVYEQIFSPLKILGVQSQFSWGVMGIKQETAIAVENNLKDKNSIYYLGKEKENLLDFKTEDHDTERFERLTDDHDRYYSYLYSAIYIKELMVGWEKSGSKIDDKPGVIATLFNIGFNNSKPKLNPQIGGAVLDINGTEYTFGGLAEEIYNSSELNLIFN